MNDPFVRPTGLRVQGKEFSFILLLTRSLFYFYTRAGSVGGTLSGGVGRSVITEC